MFYLLAGSLLIAVILGIVIALCITNRNETEQSEWKTFIKTSMLITRSSIKYRYEKT